jgi:Ca-activated chloride channel family protein
VSDVTLQRPEMLWLLPLLVIPFVVRALVSRRRFAGIATGAMLGASFRASRLRALPIAAAALSFALIVAALTDPVFRLREQQVSSRGLDIALVLDLSSSMEEVMGKPVSGPGRRTRLDVTKRAIMDFISRRPQDRVGLVVFSDNAYVVSPLTFDHEYLRRYVAMIDEHTLRSEGMTAIGEGLATAHMLLQRQARDTRQRNGVVIVFTDGEHNHGRDPVEEVGAAFDAGYRVHLIGVDLDDEVKQKPAVQMLVRAVQRRGGRYFTADSDQQLAGASRAIDRVETGVLVSTRTERNAPAYAPFATAALVLICSTLLLGAIPAFVDLT